MNVFSVRVMWSESGMFEDETLYDIDDFEVKALKVALSNPTGGYDKTKCLVTFDNGDSLECRLDLGCNNDLGFYHHAWASLQHYKTVTDEWTLNAYKDINKLYEALVFNMTMIEAMAGLEKTAIDEGLAKEKAEREQAEAKAEAERKNKIEVLPTLAEFSHLKPLPDNNHSSVEVAKNVRRDLKKHFAGTKFSVRKDGYNCIRVSWTDGPDCDDVDQVLSKFKEGHFDGMTDCYEYDTSPFNQVYGGVQYVFTYNR